MLKAIHVIKRGAGPYVHKSFSASKLIFARTNPVDITPPSWSSSHADIRNNRNREENAGLIPPEVCRIAQPSDHDRS